MSSTADSYDREMADDKPARRPRSLKRQGERMNARKPRPAALSWKFTAILAFWGAMIAAAVTIVSLARHGHAPSWRAIAMIGFNSVPLFLGLMLTWITGRWLGNRLQSRLLSTGLIMAGTVLAMMVFPAVGFYSLLHIAPAADDIEVPETLLDYLMNFGAIGYLYLATGFKYWWPFGLVLPAYMGLLHWRSRH